MTMLTRRCGHHKCDPLSS